VPQTEEFEISWSHVASGKFGHYSFDGSSTSSSYARSVFSTASLASSATDLSRNSGYSAVQIARATKELIRILQDDENLVPLYKRAISDGLIGPSRLERNLHRIFNSYAEHLGDLAGDRLEYLASRLVRLKAKLVARSIREKYDAKRPVHRDGTSSIQEHEEQEQSSDEEAEAEAVDENEFYDLVSFCDFLVGSEAFKMLHTQMRSFVLPKTGQVGEVKGTTRNVGPNSEDVETAMKEESITTEDVEMTTKSVETAQKDVENTTEDLDITTNDYETTRMGTVMNQERASLDRCSTGNSQEEERSDFEVAEPDIHGKASLKLRDRSQLVMGNIKDATEDIKTTTTNLQTAQSLTELSKTFWVQCRIYVNCSRSFTRTIGLAKDFAGTTLVRFGYLEPPLRPGHTRLRWQCVSRSELHLSSSLLDIGLTNG
jgi:hypothetical protein